MNDRIKKLREESLAAKPYISHERAVLITEFYKSGTPDRVSVPVARALTFKHLLQHKKIWIGKGELIVGERGPEPKGTPTYPELCTHSQSDLNILNSRKKIPFKVSPQTRKIYQAEIMPFWKGRSIRDRIFEEVDDAWKDAYQAGIFTEFMEQRAPGHTVLDDKIYRMGMLDFKQHIANQIEQLDNYHDPEALDKKEQLRAMDIAADTLILFAKRYADEARKQARKEKDSQRKTELMTIADICECVPAHPPRTFREALQYYWFVHLGVITELNTWDSFNPGRLDQHLYPFYVKE
ncbi:MAG: formate C-acetyltransferase/glycerol dehydratase family glycyl radical enzyme, partial [Calditrichae bacterium]|nr:formate C-acetyltransferase/glycerol dehydratase family glycyl radical enzyme [Calditrichia bacterium]